VLFQNPLVNALALASPKKKKFFSPKLKHRHPVIYVGAKTGRDGIHGASLLASAEFTEESKAEAPQRAVGDPSWKSCYSKPASKPANRRGRRHSGMGAAGLTCSTMEWLRAADTGIEIDLAKVPQRETGMTHTKSCSANRKAHAARRRKSREPEVLAVFKKWGLDAVVVGSVTKAALPASTTTAASPRKNFPRIRSPKKAPFTIAPSRHPRRA